MSERANPNAQGPDRLAGDLGVSSERTEFEGVEDTGTVGSAKGATDGSQPTDRDEAEAHPRDPAKGAEDLDEPDNPAEVPSHPNHPEKNPGHSHG